MTVCPDCGVLFTTWRENQIVERDRCYLHRGAVTGPAFDSREIGRLRRSWASASTLRTQSLPHADLGDDERAERIRRQHEASEPWRPDDSTTRGEDRLLAALQLPELAAVAA